MIHGEVIGEIWATIKVAGLSGMKMLVVRPAGDVRLQKGGSRPLSDIVAVDLVSAGVGDRVIVALGKAARIAAALGDHLPIEAAIVGIVDGIHLVESEAPPPDEDGGDADADLAAEAKEKGEKPKARAARRAPRARAPKPDDETADLFAKAAPGETEEDALDEPVTAAPPIADIEASPAATLPARAPKKRKKKDAPPPAATDDAADRERTSSDLPEAESVQDEPNRIEYDETPSVPSFEDVESIWDEAPADDDEAGGDEENER